MPLRRCDLLAIDMGRLKNTETITVPIIWERDASGGILKGFTIVSWKIPYFVNLNSNMIGVKKYASRWTSLRKKVSPIIWRKQNIFDTERIGGSLSINLEKSDRWEIVLTSTMRCPHQTVYTKNLEKDNSGQFHSGTTSNGIHHRVLPPAGGNGAILGGALTISPKLSSYVRSDLIERWNPLCAVFSQNLRRVDFQDFFEVCCS